MSSLGRSVLALVSRRTTAPSYIPAPSQYLSSSFATSSKVRLDSTHPFRAESPLDAASAQALENALNPRGQSTNDSTPSIESTPIAPVTQSNRAPPAPKSKYRIPPRPTHTLSSFASTSFSSNATEELFTLTVTATRNNTSLTFSDHTGPLFPTISGGTDKTFKNSQRASYEAAHQASLKMFEKMEEYSRSTGAALAPSAPTGRVFTSPSYSNTSGIGSRRVKVVFNGLRGGQGREAVANAIGGQEGDGIRAFIGRVEDRTGVKIGGTRGKKRRRL